MKTWRWLIILSPTLLGIFLGLFFLLYFDRSHAHIVYLRADLSTLSLMIGILVSLVVAMFFALLDREKHIHLQASSQATDEHRRFLRRLDHELKNPLTAIRAGLANLVETSSSPASNEIIASLETQTLRMSRLSSDLRKLAEIEVRQVEHLSVNVPELLHEAYQMAKEQPIAAQLSLNLSLPQAPWPLPPILGDADLLFLAVHNLLDNSLKFSRPGDTIELRAFEDGQKVVIEVADTGPGIPEEEQNHVWEELYRGDASRGIPGSGLGLALVRTIVERHGGSISLRSRLQKGTVVSLHLPTG